MAGVPPPFSRVSAVAAPVPAPIAGWGHGVAVEIRGLHHGYRTSAGPLIILDGVDLSIAAGGYMSLTGASGAGKSTLLAVLGGVERPQQGSVRVGDVDLCALRGSRLAAYRRRDVGFVFQTFGLVDVLTAQENVALAMRLARVSRGDAARRAGELLAQVGLAGRARHRPMELSGGERQRVAIARALVAEPRLLLADEPTGNLDEDSAYEVIELLEQLQRGRGCTLVLVTHNQRLAARAAQRMRIRDANVVPA